MAFAVPNSIISHPPTIKFCPIKPNFKHTLLASPCSTLRCLKVSPLKGQIICAASSAAGSFSSNGNTNPYEVLGVNPIMGFDKIKMAYRKKLKEAELCGDKDTADELEKAYDKIMMEQLTKRKKGETFGSFQVSKEIRYADKAPLIPWAPRYLRSDNRDRLINLGLSAVFIAWAVIRPGDEFKPLQILAAAFVYRVFEKLKSFEPLATPTYTEDGEDEGRYTRMGKRLVRSVGLVFGVVALACLMYSGILQLLQYASISVPFFIIAKQALIITVATSLMLWYLASYYC